MILTTEQEDLSGKEVMIVNGGWKEQFSLQLRDMSDWGVVRLRLYYNQRATLVKEISHIKFPALTLLHLEGNQLQSIEGLPTVHMPVLKRLFLNGNDITSMKVIRKGNWTSLQLLFIGSNYFGDAKCLSECYLPEVREVMVYGTWEQNNQFADHGFPSKLQSTCMQRFQIIKKNFCFHRSVQQVLRERWPRVRIF